jgi:hypothetical protein
MFTRRFMCAAISAVLLGLWATAAPSAELVYKGHLTGEASIPDPIDTPAIGDILLTVSADRRSIHYLITVSDILNPAAADLHLGPPGANGPLVVKLFPVGGAAARKGPVNGVLAEGTIDAGDLTGSMAGSKLDDLLDEMKDGLTYCNIHTNDGVDPPNSGPGDYRLGEIRGQILPQ